MKSNSLTLIAALAAVAFTTARADTAGAFDLVVGFKQTGATNDVMIDLGSVLNYTAPGTYLLGNYNTILTATFGAWANSSTLNWGAAATWKDPSLVAPTQQWVTSKWLTSTGTVSTANSIAWGPKPNSGMNTANVLITRAYTGINSLASSGGEGFSVGVAETIATSNPNSWRNATTISTFAFNAYPATIFNNQVNRLATDLETGYQFSASDLYKVGNTSEGSETQFTGTLLLFQNGDLVLSGLSGLQGYTPTVIPEPSTSAAILGVATLGFAAIRRRKQQIEAQV